MKEKFNISFKNSPKPTGLAAIGAGIYIDILINKKCCGYISKTRHDESFSIHIKVIKKDINEDRNPNCVWKNARLTVKFNEVEDAKNWIRNNLQEFSKKYPIFLME